jgi:AraC-like DNA-binding protein
MHRLITQYFRRTCLSILLKPDNGNSIVIKRIQVFVHLIPRLTPQTVFMRQIFESTHAPSAQLSPHRHRDSYAALVLDGSYTEASLDGRYSCSPGVLTVHPPWHTHANEFGSSGAVVLNFPMPETDSLISVRPSNPQALADLVRKCPVDAGHAALEEAECHSPAAPAPWLSRLVALLCEETGDDIAALAHRCGVSPEHASRACRRWFGMTPSELRREGRLQRAISLLQRGASPSAAAVESGFSDQPHLTRLLKRATGRTPAKFRSD